VTAGMCISACVISSGSMCCGVPKFSLNFLILQMIKHTFHKNSNTARYQRECRRQNETRKEKRADGVHHGICRVVQNDKRCYNDTYKNYSNMHIYDVISVPSDLNQFIAVMK
jgi:hypothetical protein